MIMNNSLGQVPPTSNPFVYRGIPSVGQVWMQFNHYPEALDFYCRIIRVDSYFKLVTYEVMMPEGPLTSVLDFDSFKEYWIFSH